MPESYERPEQPFVIHLMQNLRQKYTTDGSTKAIDQQWMFVSCRKECSRVNSNFDWSAYIMRQRERHWTPYKQHTGLEHLQDASGGNSDESTGIPADLLEPEPPGGTSGDLLDAAGCASGDDTFPFSDVDTQAYRDVCSNVWLTCFQNIFPIEREVNDSEDEIIVYDPWACSPAIPEACFNVKHVLKMDSPRFTYLGDLSSAFPWDCDSASDQMAYAGQLKWDTFQEVLKIKKVINFVFFFSDTIFNACSILLAEQEIMDIHNSTRLSFQNEVVFSGVQNFEGCWVER